MKSKIAIYALALSLGMLACKDNLEKEIISQDTGVPSSVRKSIETSFVGATEINYGIIEKDKIYSSEFTKNEENYEAKVDIKGKILEVYSTNSSVVLPEVVANYVTKNFENHKIVATILGKYNDKEAYKILLKNEKEEVTIIISTTGELLSEFRAIRNEAKYYPLKETELLPAITEYLKAKSIKFVGGVAHLNSANIKTYSISGKKENEIFTLSFDSNGGILKSSSYTIPKAPILIKTKEELPTEIANSIKEYTFVKGFVLEDKKGIKTYNLIVSKNNMIIEMLIDASGKIIRSTEKVIPVISLNEISLEELPEVIKNYLNEKFLGWTLQKANATSVNGDKIDYKITIKTESDSYNVYFDGKGNFKFSTKVYVAPVFKELSKSTLPAGIISYLDKNHTGWLFQKGSITTQNGEVSEYLVVVKTNDAYWYLYFDGKESLKTEKKSEIPSIPKAIKTKDDINKTVLEYLNKTYPNWELLEGKQDAKNTIIYLKIGEFKYTVYFNSSNEHVQSIKQNIVTNKELKKENLSKTITDYLDKTYPGWALNGVVAVYTNNELIKYELKITANDKKWAMTFDEKGTVLTTIKL